MCLPPLTPQLQNAAAARRAEAPNSVVAHTANPLVVSFNGYPLGTRFFCLRFTRRPQDHHDNLFVRVTVLPGGLFHL
jgi:hypothetical protein